MSTLIKDILNPVFVKTPLNHSPAPRQSLLSDKKSNIWIFTVFQFFNRSSHVIVPTKRPPYKEVKAKYPAIPN